MILLASSLADGQPASQPSRPALVETTTLERDAERGIVALPVGRKADLALGDRFWVFGDDGDITATGTICFITETESVVRLAGRSTPVASGQAVTLLGRRMLPDLRSQFPPGVSVRGQVLRLPPGQGTAWVDLGRHSGLVLNDSVLVRRRGIPIARGRIQLLEDDLSLCTLTPLVQNAVTQAGDSVELWPEPGLGNLGQLNSDVLAVEPASEGPVVTFVGIAADGIEEGRLIELYRDGVYVGVATVATVSDPLSQARLIESASRTMPRVGDRVIVRAGRTQPPRPLRAAVFRVEPERGYCLISVGQSDGVEAGERFVVRRPDPVQPDLLSTVAELTIATVKIDFAGAQFRSLRPDAPAIGLWEMAERRDALWPTWQPIGSVERVDDTSRTLIAQTDAASGIMPGQVCRWTPARDGAAGAALVIHLLANGKMVLHVPPGWGDLRYADGARVSRRVECLD